jgi:coenzyme Q-binding protein COQ10
MRLLAGRRFADGPRPGSCVVDFSIALRVSSPLHAHALELFFAEVAERQICAFEARCKDVYVHGHKK